MLRGEKLVEDDAHAVLDCPLYAQHRVYLFRHMPRTANLRPPASTIQILGRFLTPLDATHARALANFLYRVLYTRELFLCGNQQNAHPPPSDRHDFELCRDVMQKACKQGGDPEARVRSELLILDWLGKASHIEGRVGTY
jgi:hypothetical protein